MEGTAVVPAGEWGIDLAHSSVGFVARHLVVTRVRGKFDSFSGTIRVAERPEDSRVEIVIDAKSINTGVQQRDDHLRSPDFLNVEEYPELRFVSTGLEITGDSSFRLPGELTIRDKTHPVTLEVEFEGVTRDPWGGTRAGFSATAEIDREEFDVTWNQALETGGFVVGKKVRIEIEIEAMKV
jgi:polyisoprenoid-binding protein YceI